MAKKSRKYDVTIRMGATNYDLTANFRNGETINYDMSCMSKKELKALTFSVVSAFRESLNVKVIDHGESKIQRA